MKTLQALALSLCAALLTACHSHPDADAGPADIEPVVCGEIKKIHAVGDLYLASQPTPADFKLLKERGVKTVLDIRHDGETPDFDEQALVKELGLTYIGLPWGAPDELTDEKFDAMRAVLRNAERPLLFHCGSSNRVGAGWLTFRVLDEGVALEQALAEAKTIGLRTPAYQEKAIAYIGQQ